MTAPANETPRPRLTVAMIVADEQDVLSESLESVRAIADEIVVMDTGSADRTVDIATQRGAQVHTMPWSHSFAVARNRCLLKATGDWILWLDAGEQLDAESAAGLREFVDGQADQKKAYMMMVRIPPPDPAASCEQMAQIRLMPNHRDLRFEGRVRETLRPSIVAGGLEIDAAPGCIVRHPRQHDPARKSLRAQRDLNLATMEAAETDGPPPIRLLLAQGDAHGTLGAAKQAREAFHRVIDAAERGSTEMLDAYYGLLTSYDGDKFFCDLQIATCIEALEVFPFDAQLLLAMGNYMQNKDRLDMAGRSFQSAVEFGQVDLGTWHLGELAETAADCLSLTLPAQGKDDEALRILEEPLQRHPDSQRLMRRMIDLHVKHGRRDRALAWVDRLLPDPTLIEPFREAVLGACEAVAKQWTAALGHLQSAYVAGCQDTFCLRWLSVTLLSNGQVEAAEPVLHDWQRVDPANVELHAYLAAVAQHKAATNPPDEGAADTPQRQFRVDPGTTVLEAAPPFFPVISQNTSDDTVPRAAILRTTIDGLPT